MLRLRAGTATLLISPRSVAGIHGGRYCIDSETDIRQRLTLALQDPASREALRRFWAHWQSDARLAGVTDQSIVDRIAHMAVRGPLIVFLAVDTSVHRRDSAASRSKQVAEAQQNQVQFKPWSGPVKPPALIKVNAITPAAAKVPVAVDRSNITPPKKAIGDWTIAEKLGVIVVRAADSQKLSDDARQQLKGMLSDPTLKYWLLGSLLVWFVSQFFVVGEILDMLLVGAAMILSGAGIFFALQSLVGAAHLIGEFVEATRSAKDEKDLDAAAAIFANIIVMIGITVLIAALTHATSRATSAGEKVSTVKKPPPERPAKVEKLQERPKIENSRSEPGKIGTKEKLDEMYEAAPAAKSEIDAMADNIAAKNGGRVSKVPLKSKARALEKANNDYGGDASRVTDIARNTIVVPKEKIPSVVAALREQGAKVKEINPENDEFGYSGANSKIQTGAGIQGEIQVNSPEMIFAKEKPEIAQEILGKEQYDAIAEKAGVPGGKGHEFYEQARTLPLDSPERAKLAEQSRAYYDNFR
jgi:hypothetical protein